MAWNSSAALRSKVAFPGNTLCDVIDQISAGRPRELQFLRKMTRALGSLACFRLEATEKAFFYFKSSAVRNPFVGRISSEPT